MTSKIADWNHPLERIATAIALVAATASLLLFATGTGPALAAKPEIIKQNKAWASVKYQGDDGLVCYVITDAQKKLPTDLDHGDHVYFMLAKFPNQGVRMEAQFVTTYQMDENSEAMVTIGDQSFPLFAKSYNAWLKNPADEAAMVEAMKSGVDMKVKAVSRRGNRTEYTYSLLGVSASLADIADCK